jgi:predicted nucleic-acid-binding Zn-ribbon protein
MTKQLLLEEFDKITTDEEGLIASGLSLLEVRAFLSKAIDQTREEVKLETIKEVEYEINKFYTIRCKNCSPAWFINETLNKIKLSLNNLKQ